MENASHGKKDHYLLIEPRKQPNNESAEGLCKFNVLENSFSGGKQYHVNMIARKLNCINQVSRISKYGGFSSATLKMDWCNVMSLGSDPIAIPKGDPNFIDLCLSPDDINVSDPNPLLRTLHLIRILAI